MYIKFQWEKSYSTHFKDYKFLIQVNIGKKLEVFSFTDFKDYYFPTRL